jgi:hypothetical protein
MTSYYFDVCLLSPAIQVTTDTAARAEKRRDVLAKKLKALGVELGD